MNKLTITDIAKLANTSVSTVSRVLNNQQDVSPTTRKRVQAVIEKNTYMPNNSARNLKRLSMKAIGVIIKGFTNPLFVSMLTVIQQEIEKHHYLMLLEPVETSQDEVEAAINLCREKKPQGLIFMGGNFEHSRSMLDQLGVPFVMLTTALQQTDDGPDPASYSSVSIDDYQVSYDLTKSLYQHGHRQFAMIGPSAGDLSIGSLRLRGFLAALRDCGVPEQQVATAKSQAYSAQAGYDSASELLEKAEFTCLVCIADTLAIGALRALHDKGYKVPADISVVGFDGLDDGNFTIPSLATVKQPEAAMAYRSVTLLFDHIYKETVHQHITYEPEFLARESFRPLTQGT